jgi:(1->4)-alpha-D-glucan 1-alpha-D-glucosylmutase
VKLFVIAKALAARTRQRDVFEQGEYVPLQTGGARRDCVFAFARSVSGRSAITIVPRLIASLVPDAGSLPLGRAVWADTFVEVPRATGYCHLFTGASVPVETVDGRSVIRAADVFDAFPVALLDAH